MSIVHSSNNELADSIESQPPEDAESNEERFICDKGSDLLVDCDPVIQQVQDEESDSHVLAWKMFQTPTIGIGDADELISETHFKTREFHKLMDFPANLDFSDIGLKKSIFYLKKFQGPILQRFI